MIIIYRLKYWMMGTRFLTKEINDLIQLFGAFDFRKMVEASRRMRALEKVAGKKYLELFEHIRTKGLNDDKN